MDENTTLCKYSHSCGLFGAGYAICQSHLPQNSRSFAARASSYSKCCRYSCEETGLVGDSTVSASVFGGVLWLKIHTFGGFR